MIYDVAIIGGGPAGVAAFVYASRKGLSTILITETFGGQSSVSTDIQNWIGEPHISGLDLAEKLKQHAKANQHEKAVISEYFRATSIEDIGESFTITLSNNETVIAKNLLYTAGSSHKKMNVPGIEKFDNTSIMYCASCDGPLFAGKEVVVVGGGNAGFEAAFELLQYCPKVTLLARSTPKADVTTVQKVMADPKFTLLTNTEPVSINGEGTLESITVKNTATNEEQIIPCAAIFSEIGQIPNISLIESLVEISEFKSIKIDPWTGKTSHPRIWAAGDCTNVLYHQNNIAAGDGVRALEDLFRSFAK